MNKDTNLASRFQAFFLNYFRNFNFILLLYSTLLYSIYESTLISLEPMIIA